MKKLILMLAACAGPAITGPTYAGGSNYGIVPGALPQGRNSPQRVAHGLYAEQLSGTAFTAPRHSNRRTWFYRIRPAALHGSFELLPDSAFHNRFAEQPADPNQLRGSPLPAA